MKKVGIIGLGDMGIAMAKNIAASGFDLTGCDIREERLELLEQVGGRRASRAAEVGAEETLATGPQTIRPAHRNWTGLARQVAERNGTVVT